MRLLIPMILTVSLAVLKLQQNFVYFRSLSSERNRWEKRKSDDDTESVSTRFQYTIILLALVWYYRKKCVLTFIRLQISYRLLISFGCPSSAPVWFPVMIIVIHFVVRLEAPNGTLSRKKSGPGSTQTSPNCNISHFPTHSKSQFSAS